MVYVRVKIYLHMDGQTKEYLFMCYEVLLEATSSYTIGDCYSF